MKSQDSKRNRTYHPRGKLVDGYCVRQHPSYAVWSGMLSRCTNPNNKRYRDYGGRGITVCDDWMHFENFARDMGIRPGPDFTIERVDNDAGYSKVNCVWIPRSEQSKNRRKFCNNKSGAVGVLCDKGRYAARYDSEGVRYNIGRFDSIEEAKEARSRFVDLFKRDRGAAIKSLSDSTVWCTSSTKLRGISKASDGGFVARATVNGVRHYIGYFKTPDEAADARRKFLES